MQRKKGKFDEFIVKIENMYAKDVVKHVKDNNF